MPHLKITTKKCPCCNYEYQETKFYNTVTKTRGKYVSKVIDGKPTILTSDDEWTLARLNTKMFRPNQDTINKLLESNKIEYINQPYEEEIFDRTEITKGDKEFIYINIPNSVPARIGGTPRKISYLGMFCPKCGVFLNIDICTHFEEKII